MTAESRDGQSGKTLLVWPPRGKKDSQDRTHVCGHPDLPLLPLDPWTPMKCLLSTTALQTLPQGVKPEPPRAWNLYPGELSVGLQPVPVAATTVSLPTSRATSACACFRLASVTNVSSSCEYEIQRREGMSLM